MITTIIASAIGTMIGIVALVAILIVTVVAIEKRQK